MDEVRAWINYHGYGVADGLFRLERVLSRRLDEVVAARLTRIFPRGLLFHLSQDERGKRH
jgi:hypothetical protein